jgi:hypothetical protein
MYSVTDGQISNYRYEIQASMFSKRDSMIAWATRKGGPEGPPFLVKALENCAYGPALHCTLPANAVALLLLVRETTTISPAVRAGAPVRVMVPCWTPVAVIAVLPALVKTAVPDEFKIMNLSVTPKPVDIAVASVVQYKVVGVIVESTVCATWVSVTLSAPTPT